jgi:hypothetical protein
MSSKPMVRQSRRSTRVGLKITIEIKGAAQTLKTEGETIIVNLHGALISTATALSVGMRILIHVYLTDKRAAAHVVYIDPENPSHSGVELEKPQNIWGVSLPPADWHEDL